MKIIKRELKRSIKGYEELYQNETLENLKIEEY